MRIGNSCIRHLVLHSLANQDQLYWDIAASALILIIRHNLTSAQQLIQDDQVVEQHTHQHQFRLHHLAQQVFNTTVADFTPPSINCCVFVALLSVQLATNIISNIISSSNTSLLGYHLKEYILNSLYFTQQHTFNSFIGMTKKFWLRRYLLRIYSPAEKLVARHWLSFVPS